MTATERVYKHGSNEIVSMDDPHVYGDVFHEMSFREAIKQREFVTTNFDNVRIRSRNCAPHGRAREY